MKYTSLFPRSRRRQAIAIAEIAYCNPFLPERITAERNALGDAFVAADAVWSGGGGDGTSSRPNIVAVERLAAAIVDDARVVLRSARCRASPVDAVAFEGVAIYSLYCRHYDAIKAIAREDRPTLRETSAAFARFRDDVESHFAFAERAGVEAPAAAHLFACFFQIVRAFRQIFSTIVGTTPPAARLRAAIWQSIFTHDLRRYQRSLFDKTGDFTTLITGESGTGKELVARAIGASRYVPFDVKRGQFAQDVAGSFVPVNLSALAPTLVESELFGHRRGAFTGAVEDRRGWLQTCPPLGTIFLDEIGELDGSIQVKLLRVLQSRTFERLGDTQTLPFKGKIIAATNCDLAKAIRDGGFRQDLFYRLCSDVIETPPLRELLDGSPDELRRLVGFVARQVLPDDAERLTNEVLASARKHLGDVYAWPGNFRELEQCVRNVLIRGEYRPAREQSSGDDWLEAIRAGTLDADALLSRYCAHVYRLTGTYERAAERLKIDRRTVRARAGGPVRSLNRVFDMEKR